MSTTSRQPRIRTSGTLALALLVLVAPGIRADWSEGFDAVPNGTPLQSLPGWSRVAGGTANQTVTNSAGYAGNGIRIDKASSYYRRDLTSAEAVTAPNVPVSIVFKWRWQMAEVRYTNYQFEFLDSDNGGGNGFRIRICGNNKNDSPSGWSERDNTIQVSTGGTAVASSLMATYGSANGYDGSSRWVYGRWYTVAITNIVLSSSGDGRSVTGILSMHETDNPAVVKLSNVAIRGAGVGYGAFDRIDVVRLGYPQYDYRAVNADDFQLVSTPPPPPQRATLVVIR